MPQPHDEVHDVHDRGYRFLLSSLRLFQELVEGHVDQEWKADLDLDKAVKVDKTFVLESYLAKESDILYRVPLGDGEVYVYILVEHQSTVDFLMAFRLLVYVIEVWKYVFENTNEQVRTRKGFRLPPVFPIVVYNGDPQWTASCELRELIVDGERFGAYVPNLRYWLVDASHCNRERLRELHNGLAAIFTLEHRPRDEQEAEDILDEALAFLASESDPLVSRTALIWLRHWLGRSEVPADVEALVASLDPNAADGGRSTMVTSLRDVLIEKWTREGREEGLATGQVRGKQDYLIRILEHRFCRLSADLTEQIRAIDEVARLDALVDRALDAESPSQLFAPC